MEQKSSNVAVVVIALAVVIIVAMVCGMVMWVMQRQMGLNERLLETRLAEAQARHAEALATASRPTTPVTLSVEKATGQVTKQAPTATSTASAPVAKESESKEAVAPQKQVEAATPPAKEVKKPETPAVQEKKVQQPPARTMPVRKAPKERKDAKVGPDGQPLERIILPVGNDDLDWQF